MNKLISVLLVMAVLAVSVFATDPMGTVTYNAPANGTAQSGTVTFNATVQNATNVSFYAIVADVPSFLCRSAGGTGNTTAFHWTCTYNTAGTTDGIYNVTVNATNATTLSWTPNVTIEFDNTVPTVTFTVLQDTIKMGSPIPYTCAISDTFNTSLYSNVSLYDPSGIQKFSTTSAITNSEVDPVFIDSYGEWMINCTGRDGTSSTTPAATAVNVRQHDGKVVAVATTTTSAGKSSNRLFLFAGGMLVLIVVVVSIIAVASGGKKKKKKKGKR